VSLSLSGFFFFRCFYHGFIDLQGDQSVSFTFAALLQTFDLLYLGGLLLALRCRRWPEFFTFGIDDLQN
jgi:hypothetical protein